MLKLKEHGMGCHPVLQIVTQNVKRRHSASFVLQKKMNVQAFSTFHTEVDNSTMALPIINNSTRASSSRGNKINVFGYFTFIVLTATIVILMQNRVLHVDTLEAGAALRAAFVDNTDTANAANNGENTDSQQQQQQQLRLPDDPEHLAGLSCARYGGPSDEQAAEMVYWQDIPSDAQHLSPLHRNHPLKSAAATTKSNSKTETKTTFVDNNNNDNNNEYLTFEPDRGGFNNIRMAMETVLALAFAMGRTLVLPPEQEFYLLKQKGSKTGGEKQRSHFSFDHFFHMEAIHKEHVGLDIIRMDEFLQREMGNFRDTQTGRVTYPPGNRTKWDGASAAEIAKLYQWLRGTSYLAIWNPEECLAAFPAERKDENVQQLLDLEEKLQASPPNWEEYVGNPVPVDGSPEERLRENWAGRNKLCIYNTGMQQSRFLHFPGDNKLQSRLLTHFYAFLFFQDWKQDLWMKRFMRDHVRYVDEIQCAAARIVARLRERSPVFDSFHIRRGDFQYKSTRVEASEILEQAQKKIPDGTLVYIGTDERNKEFFNPLKEHYDVAFLDDFHDELKGINSNYYGMIDQLVASRGRTFFGCWFSTFTGYILRLRGYHANNEMAPGYEEGITNSWFYATADRFDHMQRYYPVKKVFYAREFPTSWRLLEKGLDADTES